MMNNKMDSFCRDLSHDLNNALANIMMTAEVLLLNASTEQEKEHLEDIIASTEEVSQIIQARRQSLETTPLLK